MTGERLDELNYWYKHDLDLLEEKLKTRPVLLLGGRGLGKSTLLRLLWSKKSAEVGDDYIEVIEGRTDTARARERIRQAQPKQVVFIDDLDIICAVSEDEESLDGLKKGLWTLLQLNQPRHDSFSYLATACLDVVSPSYPRLVESIQKAEVRNYWLKVYSLYTQNLEQYRLDPWRSGWEQHWKEGFDRIFRKKLGNDATLLSAWRNTILDLTGAHPALFGPALRRLDELCQAQRKLELAPFEQQLISPKRSADPELPHRIRVYVEDLLARDAVRRINSSLRKLRDSDNPIEAKAFEALLRIAQRDQEGVKLLAGAHVRQVLVDEGLVYQDWDRITGNFVVPGSIIREQVIQLAGTVYPVFPRVQVVLEKDQAKGDSGNIIISSSAGVETVSLNGTPWRLLEVLYSKQNEVVSKHDLQELVGLNDDKAVLNAIQRLQQKLKIHQLSNTVSISNEYGKGYRLTIGEI